MRLRLVERELKNVTWGSTENANESRMKRLLGAPLNL